MREVRTHQTSAQTQLAAVAEVSEATCTGICLVCRYLAKRETRAREISAHRAAVYTHAHTHKVLVMCHVSQQT